MTELPKVLRRGARVTHDAVGVRLLPVHAPPHPALRLLIGALFLTVPVGLGGIALQTRDPAALQVSFLSVGVLMIVGFALPGLGTVRSTEITIGAASLRWRVVRTFGATEQSLPLADLTRARVRGEVLVLETRDGEEHEVPVPARSRATYDALEAWFERIQARSAALGDPSAVPGSLRVLREGR